MRNKHQILFGLAALFGALVLFRILLLPDILTRQLAVVPALDDRTPADEGLPYEDASFEVGGDRLNAWFVRALEPKPVAFLLIHGDGESVSDWIPVQDLLYDQGYSSLVYDFAGYGHSEGRPSTNMFEAEPRRALQALLDRLDSTTEVSVLGHSLGAAIAVEAFHDYEEPRIRSLVFNSGPPGLRDIMREILGVPALLTMLLPNLIDAKNNVGDLQVPVLVVGSETDELFSTDMIRRVYDGATEPRQLLIRKNSGHNELMKANLEWWRPILRWVDAS